MNARRFVHAGLAVGLVASGLAAAGASAAPGRTRLPACPSWTDKGGDAYFQDSPVGQPADSTLDITKVRFTVSGGTFRAYITVPKYAATSTDRDGDQFDAIFTVKGKEIDIFGNDGATWTVLENAFARNGIQVDGTYVQRTNEQVTRTRKGGVIILSTSLSSIGAAAGVPVTGATISRMQATSSGTYEAVIEPFDSAVAPRSKTMALKPCR